MALPTSPEEWVSYLAIRHDTERTELETYDRYYEGQQALTYMHPEILREVGDRIQPVIVFWPQLIVDAIQERLDIKGFLLPDADSSDEDLWRVYQANDLDEGSQLAHTDALVMRRSYVSVGTNEADRDTPLVVPESPLEMFADIDPRTREVRAALKRVAEADLTGSEIIAYTTLYLPDRTIWYEGNREVDRDEHNLGAVPVVPIVNRGRIQCAARTPTRTVNRFGRSELDAVIPLSDAVCKLATDMMVGAEFVAIPLRGLLGIGPDDLEDQNGNKLTALQAIMGRLLTIPDTDAKTFEFAAAQLSNFSTAIEQLAKLAGSISGLPPHYFGFSTENPASADAIRSSEARLIKRAERKQKAFGSGWARVMRLVRLFQSGEQDPALKRLQTDWYDAATPTVAQRADAAVKLYNLPEPIVTKRQTRKDLGYSDVTIARMEAEEREQQAADLAEFKLQTAAEAANVPPAGAGGEVGGGAPGAPAEPGPGGA